MSCNLCHTCQNLRPVNGAVKCAKGHKIKYRWPESSVDMSYGFVAPGGCAASFVARTPDYYEVELKRGRKPKLLKPEAVLQRKAAA